MVSPDEIEGHPCRGGLGLAFGKNEAEQNSERLRDSVERFCVEVLCRGALGDLRVADRRHSPLPSNDVDLTAQVPDLEAQPSPQLFPNLYH